MPLSASEIKKVVDQMQQLETIIANVPKTGHLYISSRPMLQVSGPNKLVMDNGLMSIAEKNMINMWTEMRDYLKNKYKTALD
jgi:hypothetical protein